MSQTSRRTDDAWHDRLEVDGDVDTPWLDSWRLPPWFALHSLVVAEKPCQS